MTSPIDPTPQHEVVSRTAMVAIVSICEFMWGCQLCTLPPPRPVRHFEMMVGSATIATPSPTVRRRTHFDTLGP